MERGFPQVSHRQSICEYFPLRCVANLALGQASKCWHSPWKGVPVPSLPLTHPSPAATTQGPALGWQILCVAARKSHFPYLPSMPPTGLPYAAGSRKTSLPGTREHTFSEKSNVHGVNQTGWGRFSKFSAHLPAPEKEQMGSHLKCQCCLLVIFLGAEEFSRP